MHSRGQINKMTSHAHQVEKISSALKKSVIRKTEMKGTKDSPPRGRAQEHVGNTKLT